jgi:glycine/D-amino acid oxidase-like deaminating enzyme
MSRQLDLHGGDPVWRAYRSAGVPVQPLTRDARAEVVVVGMGVSGAMMAETLTADGRDVIVLDRRGPSLGSTASSTALVQFEIDTPLTLLADRIGRDARRAWRRSRLAVGNLKARIETLGIACGMAPRRSLYLAGNVLTGSALRDEADARRAAGIHARYLTAGALRDAYGIDRDGAIESCDNLELDPVKLTRGLLRTAAERGARLHAPTEATAFRHSASGVRVETADGGAIEAGAVVLATGYELAAGVPDRGHQIISTWAIATRPQPGALWPGRALMWEASDPYLYARATPDGRVVCGGEDEEFSDDDSRDSLIPRKSARIAAKLSKLLPGIDPTPDYAWAGAFGSTSTGLPIIGPVPRKPRILAVMGYGGNGITYSQIASEIVSTSLAGGRDCDADLFSLPR